MKATIDIDPSKGTTLVALFDEHHTIWVAAEAAYEAGKPYVWFNGRIWVVVSRSFNGEVHHSAIETDRNTHNLPPRFVEWAEGERHAA